jgi:hypothetical protein
VGEKASFKIVTKIRLVEFFFSSFFVIIYDVVDNHCIKNAGVILWVAAKGPVTENILDYC